MELVTIFDPTNSTCRGCRWAIVPVVDGLRGDYAKDDLGRWCPIPVGPSTWVDREVPDRGASSQWPPRLPPVLVGSPAHERAVKCGWTPPRPAAAIDRLAFKAKLQSLLVLEEASELHQDRGRLLGFDSRNRHAYLDRARKHYEGIPEPRDQKLREVVREAHRSATRFADYPAGTAELPTVREVLTAHGVEIEME